MKKTKVGFQGEHGAFSEAAILSHFRGPVATIPHKTIRETFNSIEAGSADAGVVPVENSIEGSVYETYDMLLTSSVKVAGEIVLRVVHCLIGLPGSKITDVKAVYSHPQALAQCRGFIASLPIEPIITYDTAGSVKMIKEKRLRDAAAIASDKAAELYGMDVLAKGIEDYGRNYTRFFIISMNEAKRTKDSKTSLIFSVPHTPGSLYKALEAFARRGINLTKIESRPTRQRPWEYYFFLDFEGHRQDRDCARVLRELATKTVLLKVLGSYPKSKTELT
ncbi:MAG: prephenate dehydratase [Thaumarchaeota archaeon]|nr:prephenate dehydratase [Nitrososphaerota archaeon]MBI3023534.1 prephenate dehydratase [Nitrososphaerota archaeon]